MLIIDLLAAFWLKYSFEFCPRQRGKQKQKDIKFDFHYQRGLQLEQNRFCLQLVGG